MSLYNMLFGRNPQSGLLLAVIGLKEPDIDRFRDVFVEDGGDHLEICVHTRTGGGNRDDFPNTIMRKRPEWSHSVDDDGDFTYANDYFTVPDEYADDVRSLSDILGNGLRAEFCQHLAKTINRDPTDDDKHAAEYDQEHKKLQRTAHYVLNGHTFVPYDDAAMKVALDLAEANDGGLKVGWRILPAKIDVLRDYYRWTSAKDLARVDIKTVWEVDDTYWEHCQERWSESHPKTMAKIAEFVEGVRKPR